MPNELEDEAYDRAMDSLSRSKQNELLAKVSMQRAEAKAYAAQLAGGPGAEIERGFLRQVLRFILIGVGMILELVGKLYLIVGSTIRGLGEAL